MKPHRGAFQLGATFVAVLCGHLACAQPAGNFSRPADKAAPRTEHNSEIAHEQLVAKAKRGGIDVYFLGDSITRRWGATDYQEFLANWNTLTVGDLFDRTRATMPQNKPGSMNREAGA